MYSALPDLVILLGFRSSLSLVGIALIVIGGWWMDRIYDDTPPPALGFNQNNNVTNNTEGGGMENYVKFPASADDAIVEPVETSTTSEDWELVCQPPRLSRMEWSPPVQVALAGWVLLAISYLLDRQKWMAFDVRPLAIVALLFTCLLAVAHVVWHRQAMMDRTVRLQMQALALIMGGGMAILGFVTSALDPDAPSWCAILGALAVAASHVPLWYARRKGHHYDLHASVQAHPVVFHFGGPLLVFGWFWFWMGMNAINANPDYWYLPVYLGGRAALAYVGVTLILIALWMVCYAWDETSEESLMHAHAFGVAGRFFGHAWEIKVVLVLCYFVFAVSIFCPYMASPWGWLLFIALIGYGFTISYFYETALRSHLIDLTKRWERINSITGLVVWACWMVAQADWTSRVLATLGIPAFMVGRILLHQDRKRGQFWLETSQVNPSPVVFSFGSLLITLGLLLMAWALSIRP